MKVSMSRWPQPRQRRPHKRVIAALCMCAMLAACAQGNTSADLAPSPAPQPAAQAAAPAAPAPQAALTPEEAKTQCWMKYESDKKVKNIDQRLALVEKCVSDTMRGQLVQAPER